MARAERGRPARLFKITAFSLGAGQSRPRAGRLGVDPQLLAERSLGFGESGGRQVRQTLFESIAGRAAA